MEGKVTTLTFLCQIIIKKKRKIEFIIIETDRDPSNFFSKQATTLKITSCLAVSILLNLKKLITHHSQLPIAIETTFSPAFCPLASYSSFSSSPSFAQTALETDLHRSIPCHFLLQFGFFLNCQLGLGFCVLVKS